LPAASRIGYVYPAGGRKFTKFRLFAACLFGQG
jgi:hypothetical protein